MTPGAGQLTPPKDSAGLNIKISGLLGPIAASSQEPGTPPMAALGELAHFEPLI